MKSDSRDMYKHIKSLQRGGKQNKNMYGEQINWEVMEDFLGEII